MVSEVCELPIADSKKRGHLMKRVVVIPEGHTEVGGDLGDINGLVEVHNVLSLWVHLHEDLVLAHKLDNLTDVGSWLVQQLKLLPQHADYLRVRRLSQDTKSGERCPERNL